MLKRHLMSRPRLAVARRSFRAMTVVACVVAVFSVAPRAAAEGAGAERLLVFAAASLRTALDEVEAAFEAETDVDLVVSYAGSSALARQIEAGAPADVFISASPDWMDRLEAAGLIAPATRSDLLGNRLVLVRHGPPDASGGGASAPEIGSDFDIAGLIGEGKLAMALVDAVPAGIYGKAALSSLGLWGAVAPHVAQTDNVRAALALVAAGAAPLGVVYATDAAAEPGVTVVGTFPADSHPPIVYPTAAVAGREAAAGRFLAFLQGPAATGVFVRQGFAVLTE